MRRLAGLSSMAVWLLAACSGQSDPALPGPAADSATLDSPGEDPTRETGTRPSVDGAQRSDAPPSEAAADVGMGADVGALGDDAPSVHANAPAAPVIRGPKTVRSEAKGLVYSLTPQPGCTYVWSVDVGTITSTASGTSVTLDAAAIQAPATAYAFTVSVVASNASGSTKADYPVMVVLTIPANDGATGNLVFNGGFELGTAGFETNKYLRPSTNKAMTFDGPVIDATTSVSGKSSLKVSNQYSEAIELFGKGIKLKPATAYTMSFSVKSSGPAVAISQGLVSANWYAHAKKCTAGSTWQRCVFPLTTKGVDEETPGQMITYRTGWEETDAPHVLWLDDLQLVEGVDRPFGASAEVELAATSSRDLYFPADGPAIIELTAHNTSAREVHGSVVLRREEDAGDPPTEVDSWLVTLAPGERRTFTRSLTLGRFGSFTVVPEAVFDATTSVLPAWFASAGKYEPRQTHIDTDRTFVVGFNGGMNNSYGPKDSVRGSNASPDDYAARVASLGGRLIRNWDTGLTFTWNVINPVDEATPDYTTVDYVTSTLFAHGISTLPVLGAGGLARKNPTTARPMNWPQWVLDASTVLTDFSSADYYAFLAPDDLWRRHVRSLVSRYRDRIDHWEVFNEPNLWLGSTPESAAARYLPYLRSAAEEVRSLDPNAKVVGYCINFGYRALDFAKAAYADEGLDFADVVSFHPYAPQSLASTEPADLIIRQLKKLASDHGKPAQRHWNTELYYLAERVGSGFERVIRPRDVARRILTDLGEGVGQSISVFDDALWRKTLNPQFDANAGTSRWLPSANMVAYNAFARLLEGAEPKAKLAWSTSSVAYVYERDGRALAAAWVYRPGDDQPIELPTALKGSLRLDVYGNPLATSDGSFLIGQTPQYIVAPEGMSTADFVAGLQGAPLPQIVGEPAGTDSIGQKVVLRTTIVPWPGRTITKVSLTANGQELGQATYDATTQTWELPYTTTTLGAILLRATAVDSAGHQSIGSGRLQVGSVGTYGNEGQPWRVPATGTLRLELENFDEGGEGLAYHDDDGQNGNSLFRFTQAADEPDLRAATDEGKPAVAVGSTNNGEWLRYTVDVPETGTYKLRLRAANATDRDAAKAVTIRWKGKVVAGPLTVPITGSWDKYVDVDATGVTLEGGVGVLQVECGNWGTAWNWLEIGR